MLRGEKISRQLSQHLEEKRAHSMWNARWWIWKHLRRNNFPKVGFFSDWTICQTCCICLCKLNRIRQNKTCVLSLMCSVIFKTKWVWGRENKDDITDKVWCVTSLSTYRQRHKADFTTIIFPESDPVWGCAVPSACVCKLWREWTEIQSNYLRGSKCIHG